MVKKDEAAQKATRPVSFKVTQDAYVAFNRVAVDHDVSMSSLVEWFVEHLAELYEARQLAPLTRDRKPLALVALTDAAYTAASLRAEQDRLSLAAWIRRVVERALGDEVSVAAPDDAVVPVSEQAWSVVVGAVADALANGVDVLAAFYTAMPWSSISPRVVVDDAALLRRAIREADVDAAIRRRARRTLGSV